MKKSIKKRKYKKLFQGKVFKRIIIGTILVILASFFINIWVLVFMIIVIIFNAKLALFQLQKGLPSDFELSTFSTIVMTQAFGLKIGIFTAVFTKVIASIYSGYVIADHFVMIGTYILAAIVASFFRGANTFTLGLIIVVMNNIIMFMVSKNLLRIDHTANISYTLTNFSFNLIVFSVFGNIIPPLLV
ncbi:hypothetical protein JXB41_00655 [Candidatus Woesearchaeota archaeon]|nr:hypothetical protein [Candidatus Woesearchaeota archaeon]